VQILGHAGPEVLRIVDGLLVERLVLFQALDVGLGAELRRRRKDAVFAQRRVDVLIGHGREELHRCWRALEHHAQERESARRLCGLFLRGHVLAQRRVDAALVAPPGRAKEGDQVGVQPQCDLLLILRLDQI
jgi:hypothetical protein